MVSFWSCYKEFLLPQPLEPIIMTILNDIICQLFWNSILSQPQYKLNIGMFRGPQQAPITEVPVTDGTAIPKQDLTLVIHNVF